MEVMVEGLQKWLADTDLPGAIADPKAEQCWRWGWCLGVAAWRQDTDFVVRLPLCYRMGQVSPISWKHFGAYSPLNAVGREFSLGCPDLPWMLRAGPGQAVGTRLGALQQAQLNAPGAGSLRSAWSSSYTHFGLLLVSPWASGPKSRPLV